LNSSLLRFGYGFWAIWSGLRLWRGHWDAFWQATMMLGISSAGFIFAIALPGYAAWQGVVLDPGLYVIAVLFGLMAKRS